jgi:hypothetical protein
MISIKRKSAINMVWTPKKALVEADKSGVPQNSLPIPKSPGSIEGPGKCFQRSLNTGTAQSAIALKPPPGAVQNRQGMTRQSAGQARTGAFQRRDKRVT